MITKRWRIIETMPSDFAKQHDDVHPVLKQILYNRGLHRTEEIAHFMVKEDPRRLLDPFDFKDMQKAVDRIMQAIDQREKIIVYGDFDADGVTATTLLMQVLTHLSADAHAYIPHRVDEGYGLNSEALRNLASDGAHLVITVDCGIRSIQEVEDGKSAGLDMIITDHHSVGSDGIVPDALAVVNPQQADCAGDNRIAGVGVALMLAHALLKTILQNGNGHDVNIRYSDLLDLVAIGTVADIMPLNAPINRMFVKHGLTTMQQERRVGLNALLQVAGIASKDVDAMSIGFGIGPRINAAGRLDSAMQAYNLLSASDIQSAMPLAQELQHLNVERQNITRDAHQRITEALEASDELESNLIFAQDDQIPQGIVGLVAGRLAQSLYRPTIVLEVGKEESHASCRSIPEFHITQALDKCADLLVRHGGHAMAAGLTIRNENIPAFKAKMKQLANEQLAGLMLTPTLEIDMELTYDQLDLELVDELMALEPTGHQNPVPCFVTRDLRIVSARTVGKDNAHLKLTLTHERGAPIDAIAFRMGERLNDLPPLIDVAFNLERNVYQGRVNLQMNIRDIQPAQSLTS
jgi:single-stranded-DNA-specific exonuclease